MVTGQDGVDRTPPAPKIRRSRLAERGRAVADRFSIETGAESTTNGCADECVVARPDTLSIVKLEGAVDDLFTGLVTGPSIALRTTYAGFADTATSALRTVTR